jgi:hypothetical protein
MGNATTKNVIENHIQSSIDIINSAVQDCSTTMKQEQLLDIIGDGNNISHIDFSSMMNADISCIQAASVQNDIQSKISNNMQQMAKSILGALSLNPGSAKAENIMKSSIKMGAHIQNTFNQKCGTKLNSSQVLRVRGNNNTASYMSYKTAASIIKNCVTTSSAVNKATQDILNQLKQTATAEKKGLSLGFMIFIIILVLGSFGLGGTVVLTSPPFIIGVLTLIGGYTFVSWSQGWWPFPPSKKKVEKDD